MLPSTVPSNTPELLLLQVVGCHFEANPYPDAAFCLYSNGNGQANYDDDDTCTWTPTAAVTVTSRSFNLAAGDTLDINSFGTFTGMDPPGLSGLTVPGGTVFTFSSNGDGTTSTGFEVCLARP